MKESREELEKKCAEAEAKAEQYQHQVQRLENRIRDQREAERKRRRYHLITRGAESSHAICHIPLPYQREYTQPRFSL